MGLIIPWVIRIATIALQQAAAGAVVSGIKKLVMRKKDKV